MTFMINRGLSAAAFAAVLCLSTAAFAQQGSSPLSVFQGMFGQKPSGEPARTTGQDGAQDNPTDQVVRIEHLEQQIRQLTGTIEQLQYRNQQLEAQIRSMGGTAGTAAAVTQPGQAQPMRPPVQSGPAAQPLPPPAAAPGRRADVFDPSQSPNAPGAPRPLGSMPSEPPPVVTAEPPVGVPGGRTAGQPLDLSTLATGAGAARANAEPGQPPAAGPLPPPPSRNLSATGAVASVAPPAEQPKDYYDLGYGYVQRKDYALAQETFEAFLKKFPNDRRAADAQFWLGESLFQRQRFDAAAQAFLELSTKHAGNPKAPDALLRLAQSLSAMKQKEMSCATLAEVGRKYPKASASVKQGVAREQKRVHC